MNLKSKSLVIIAISCLAIVGFLFQSCEKSILEDESKTNIEVSSLISERLNSEIIVHMKIQKNPDGTINYKNVVPQVIKGKNFIVRLKSAPVESSDGEKWKDSTTKKTGMGAGKYVADNMEEYGGDCIESRTEAIDEDGDGDTDSYKVYTRPCNWN
jgi:hypothetical protein